MTFRDRATVSASRPERSAVAGSLNCLPSIHFLVSSSRPRSLLTYQGSAAPFGAAPGFGAGVPEGAGAPPGAGAPSVLLILRSCPFDEAVERAGVLGGGADDFERELAAALAPAGLEQIVGRR